MSRLTGKNALVTGGRQGIGRAIVEALFADGAQVMTCGRGARPSKLSHEITWHTTDVGSSSSVADLTEAVLAQFSTLDVLVNNAGVQIEKNILDTSDDDWDLLMGANAKGVFNLCRAMIPVMGEGGSIINIGSISANIADPSMALYNASKAFVHGLTRSIAVDHGPRVRCNAISPGWILTGMSDAAFAQASCPESAQNDAIQRHAAGRLGKPEDVAKLACWLASDDSEFATGQCYAIDGGLSAASPLRPGLF
ncbi:MAG: SDR family oxidoreductase [Pseudomonadota bacterium]